MAVYRTEYPRPQFVRESWLNLNGPWSYQFDFGVSGVDRKLFESTGFADVINVPFCPESKLSGVEYKDFIPQIFYHRKLTIPENWRNQKILLHFGGVDYECEAWLNGQNVGLHYGGQCSFTFDLTKFAEAGKTCDLVVRARDDQRSGVQPYGKQCSKYFSAGCSYTRTTGIWQTVWLEAAPLSGLEECRITPALDAHAFVFRPRFYLESRDHRLRVTVSGENLPAVTKTLPAVSNIDFTVELGETVRFWSPEDPFLYDILFEVLDAAGNVIDTVKSYGGLRKIHIEGDKVFLNNQPLFQRLVLDQGFYPDGVWTAPSDAALKQDIELAMAAGFNGARLHQKVFEDRFHYWADKLGYLTWGESSSWGASFCGHFSHDNAKNLLSLENFKEEWRQIVGQAYNHPSIIAWSPTNETWPGDDLPAYRRIFTEIYEYTKVLDPTRPVNECSGYHHTKTDLWTVHFYRKDAAALAESLFPPDAPVGCKDPAKECGYTGQPYINDEWGGFKFIPASRKKYSEKSWGYNGLDPKTPEELCALIREQAKLMNNDPRLQGWCYTQLTDVEQEQNGIYNYDRTPKGDPDLFKAAFTAR